ncbi:MBOAT family O-acyltransferase [Marinomonas sp. MED121]|uniref:MBOAT family O-acyltransferase n=1 Tax=Marinomonas sp. MED121 TaxID=314277 RepID=UPI0013EF8102|nr:MBOAT family O-acyltransferase [Marinomonas sp. MED121]
MTSNNITESEVISLNRESSISIKVLPNGYAMSAFLHASINGEVYIKQGNTFQKPGVGVDDNTFKEIQVKTKVSPNSITELIIYSDDERAIIKDIKLKVYKAKRASDISGNIIYYFFISISILGLFTRKLSQRKSNLLFIAVSSFILFSLSKTSFFLIFLFLFLSYFFINKTLITKKNKKKYFFITTSLLITIVLITVKILIPSTNSIFLNPGGIFLAIPLGFSYFIIKSIDVSIDSYKGNLKSFSLQDYFAYMLFPSTLAAGPIKTYKQYLNAKNSDYSVIDFSAGFSRVLLGISKKVLADTYLLPSITTQIDLFAQNSSNFELNSVAFFMLIQNFLYIYLDFTAYCDMAIGSSRCMGYKVPENFKWPLLRTSITQYWQHWHMTLSSWARKVVFMNVMLSTRSIFLATFCTMVTIGLWHKLSLGWLSWAIHHTILMRLENRLATSDFFKKAPLIKMNKLFCFIKSIFMIMYVWFFVAAGQSFIIFTDFNMSILAYYSMLASIPLWIINLI